MEQFTPKAFGKRVLQARLDAGARRGRALTQTEVAEKLGVAQVSVGRWESGDAVPDPATIQKLAGILNVSAADLMFGPAGGSEPLPSVQKRKGKAS